MYGEIKEYTDSKHPYWRVIKRILHISAYSLLGAGYNEWFYTPMSSALEQQESYKCGVLLLYF